MKRGFYLVLSAISVLLFCSACTKDSSNASTGGANGSVSISGVGADYSRASGLRSITCTVTAKGVTVNDVMELGFYYSTEEFSKYHSGSKRLLGSGILSKSGTVLSVNSKTKYYVRGYLKTESGVVYSPSKTVTTQ